MGLSDSNNNKTKPAPVSKQCVAGFVLACVGAASFYILYAYGSSHILSTDLKLSGMLLITIELLAAFVLSTRGVVSAGTYHYRFRMLGILGVVISAVPLLIALGLLLLMLFHERPPQPPT